jgi:glycosyltransferase involved in cell wall biosynthesis
LFVEVVVADDGSSDGTADAAAQAGGRVVRLGRNSGKPAAMRAGLAATSAPVVCFLDADLLQVTPEHLQLLVMPVVQGEQLAQLAVFSGGRLATTLAQQITPMISGQRCLGRALLAGFPDWDSGFGIETALNAWLLEQGIAQHIVQWAGAAQVMKEEKRGVLRGFAARLGMYRDIVKAWAKSKRRKP